MKSKILFSLPSHSWDYRTCHQVHHFKWVLNSPTHVSLLILQILYQLKWPSHHFAPFRPFSWCFRLHIHENTRRPFICLETFSFTHALKVNFLSVSIQALVSIAAEAHILPCFHLCHLQEHRLALHSAFFFFNLLLCVFVLTFLLYLAFTDLLLSLKKTSFFFLSLHFLHSIFVIPY